MKSKNQRRRLDARWSQGAEMPVVVGVRQFNVQTDLWPVPRPVCLRRIGRQRRSSVPQTGPMDCKRNQLRRLRRTACHRTAFNEQAFADPPSASSSGLNARPIASPGLISMAGFKSAACTSPTVDDHFKPLIACNDPGEAPLERRVLIAQAWQGILCVHLAGVSFVNCRPACLAISPPGRCRGSPPPRRGCPE